MAILQQTQPNVHEVLKAIRELEKHPAVAAYIALLNSLKEPEPWPLQKHRD
jgi:hypothetical protein